MIWNEETHISVYAVVWTDNWIQKESEFSKHAFGHVWLQNRTGASANCEESSAGAIVQLGTPDPLKRKVMFELGDTGSQAFRFCVSFA